MIVLDPKHNWKDALCEVMTDLGFIVVSRGKNHIHFSYRLSKINFTKEHGIIKCNRSTFFKYDDGNFVFYPEEYKDACEKRADDKIQRTRNMSALETKVMMFRIELEAILEKLIPTLKDIDVIVSKDLYKIHISFSHKILEFMTFPNKLETLLDNSLFEIELKYCLIYDETFNQNNRKLSFNTLQEFLDHIQSESFQSQMSLLANSIDQDKKDSLAAEIKDLEKSIQWRKSELEKMIQDEKNVINKLF